MFARRARSGNGCNRPHDRTYVRRRTTSDLLLAKLWLPAKLWAIVGKNERSVHLLLPVSVGSGERYVAVHKVGCRSDYRKLGVSLNSRRWSASARESSRDGATYPLETVERIRDSGCRNDLDARVHIQMVSYQIRDRADDSVTGVQSSTFETFYRRQFVATARLAMLLTGSSAAATDLAEDAMIVTQRRWHNLDTPAAYLRMVTINLCRNHNRRRVRELRWLRAQRPQEQAPAEIDEALVALHQLTDLQRSIVVLRFYEDLTIPQIARLLEKPEGSIKSALHRALATLKEVW